MLATVRGDRPLWYGFLVALSIDLTFTLWWGFSRLLYNLDITQEWYEIRFLRIDADGGLPEWFNYAQIVLAIVLLARLFVTTRQIVYSAYTVVFTFVLVDDFMEIHEEGGKYFAKALQLKPLWGMRPVDSGEVITWAIVGAVAVPLVVVGLLLSKRTHVVNGLALTMPFLALVFFALVVDQVYHVLRDAFFGADILLGMLEDGGEMVAITVECALAAALVRAGPTFADESS